MVEITVDGDAIRGHVVRHGVLCSRGMIVRGPLSEEEALSVIAQIRGAHYG